MTNEKRTIHDNVWQKEFLQRLARISAEKGADVRTSRRTKPEITEERVTNLEDRVEVLERAKDELKTSLEEETIDLRKEFAMFIFQTVAIVVGIIAVILAVSVRFSMADSSDTAERLGYIEGLLGAILVVFSAWFVLWSVKNFRKKRPKPR